MSEHITIPTPAGPAEAYVAGEPGRPGVLFFVDAIGLRPQVEQMADRIASWGYLVLVPHVFHRDGSAAELAPQGDLREAAAREAFFAGGAMDRVHAYTPDLSGPDTDAWLAALAERAGEGPVGVTGYCMGVRLAVRAAGRHPGRVAAVGGWHGGGVVVDAPDSPHLAIAGSTATYAFGHADHDSSMPPEAVAALEEALVAAGRPHTNEVFAGATHGYTMADTSAYDEEAAERHFAQLRDLFARTLG
ncbi:dienelactone hydrolase family protein [Nocardioides marmotae]|uniref:dienelactone hydrolase family protein n=1 Tax=Nocardioides marmotae TaxID=2663857 RepID=UPI0012B595BF|nr:dienelactone hydrolase family protein [Nocardioides marmotae]MBC9734130.1 dienelactone hydrolase family protein [Nocardioides marmotae]MTB85233.1 dienelactone hydrolase family protein [Nocardioides marmotae]